MPLTTKQATALSKVYDNGGELHFKGGKGYRISLHSLVRKGLLKTVFKPAMHWVLTEKGYEHFQ